MPLFVRHAPVRRLRRAYRAYRSQPRLGGPLAIGVALAIGGHTLAGAASATSAAPVAAPAPAAVPVAAGTAYRVSDAELLYARPAAAPARPAAARVPARSSRSTQRVAPKPAAPAKPRSAGRWVRPTRGPVTSPYGMRWGRLHKGLDFGAPHGAAVVATFDGTVVHAGWGLSGYGRQVQVRHAGGVVTTYSHLSAITVPVGAKVTAGQLIGKVGSTGNVTGPHLHFEIHVGGAAVNPRPFLRTRGLTV